ncbi:hypothetical protein [Ilumatobacter fluminis]|uniref:hypothetical protein n=1 Tax=Ilumatobacter fluminis TaxID=467091 RepID=UPI001414DC12|nr:hypothetical protein [Ilumatobacter fluminis]
MVVAVVVAVVVVVVDGAAIDVVGVALAGTVVSTGAGTVATTAFSGPSAAHEAEIAVKTTTERVRPLPRTVPKLSRCMRALDPPGRAPSKLSSRTNQVG